MTYQRSYAFVGNSVAFACTETSSEPLPSPTVPGIDDGSKGTEQLRLSRGAIGEVLAQLAVETSDEAKAAAVERARVAQAERAELTAVALRQRELEQEARQRWAVEQVARGRPALPPLEHLALAAPTRPALEPGRRP